MLKMKADSRTRLLQAAEKTAYLHGFGSASIADIAKEAKVPVGNVYYYFKTKDEIAAAIVDLRVSRFKKQLQDLEKAESPKDRLCGFVDIKIRNSETLARHGCPVGTLCSELQKYGGASAKKSRALFAEALTWMERQFEALGKGTDSRACAVHLLSATQGVSVLAHTFHDPTMIKTEAARLKQWIQAL
jgi:AcrR family transcriptional regulator